MAKISKDRINDHFVGYICEQKADSQHVRRIAGWLGFVIGAIDRISVENGFSRTRQFWFKIADGVSYKVRYGHGVGSRGGLQIVEYDPSDLRRDGAVVREIRSIQDAEDFYNTLQLSPRRAA